MSKKTDWGKVFRATVNDIICAIKTPSNKPKQPTCPNPKARICILILIGIFRNRNLQLDNNNNVIYNFIVCIKKICIIKKFMLL